MIAFVLAGASSGVGKTTVATLLMHALTTRGYTVQAFKCGPDYLDPTFHSYVTGRPSINLDLHLMGADGLKDSFWRYSQTADVAIVEGVMGMYDGADDSLDNGSSAHIARLLGLPVLLLLDGRSVAASLAASGLGFKMYDSAVDLRGVIINNVSGEKHFKLQEKPLRERAALTAYGYLARLSEVSLESRHLGLKPSGEVKNIDKILDKLLQASRQSIDYDAILRDYQLTTTAAPIAIAQPRPSRYRMAIAQDDAFFFYYQENLDLLKQRGFQLIPFSPLTDEQLPADIDAIYIGGGYPELHLAALADNVAIKNQIAQSIAEGMPTYAECGGLMYLSEAIETVSGDRYPMVGAFQGSAQMTKRLQHFGYVTVQMQQKTILGDVGTELTGHEFHRSKTTFDGGALAYRVTKKSAPDQQWQCGALTDNLLATYTHTHFKGNPHLLDALIETIERRRHG